MQRSKRPGFLIAVELGAEWPEALAPERSNAVRRVVAQTEGETPEAFAARLGSLVGRLFPARVELRDVVIACNERTDASATVARRSLGGVLLERLGPSGTFVLAAGPGACGRLRHALSALATDLALRAIANVTVHFEGDRARLDERVVARVA